MKNMKIRSFTKTLNVISCKSVCKSRQVSPKSGEIFDAYFLGMPRTVAKFQVDTFSSADSGKLLDSKVILLELFQGTRVGLKVGRLTDQWILID